MTSLLLKNKNHSPDATCECGEFFKSKEFKNLCSRCFIKKYENTFVISDKLFLKFALDRRYNEQYLKEFTKNRCLPEDHFLLASLKKMFETGALIHDSNFLDWVEYLEKKTIYRGINLEQAIELKALADNNKHNYQKLCKIEEYWKIGHNICCLIIDWWNLPNINLCRVQCYYHKTEKGTLPRKSNNALFPAAIFDRRCKYQKECKNFNKDVKNCKIYHNHMLEFTLKNLAINY